MKSSMKLITLTWIEFLEASHYEYAVESAESDCAEQQRQKKALQSDEDTDDYVKNKQEVAHDVIQSPVL